MGNNECDNMSVLNDLKESKISILLVAILSIVFGAAAFATGGADPILPWPWP